MKLPKIKFEDQFIYILTKANLKLKVLKVFK
jgi:hypothetical protein